MGGFREKNRAWTTTQKEGVSMKILVLGSGTARERERERTRDTYGRPERINSGDPRTTR